MDQTTTDVATQDEALTTAQPPVDEQPAEAVQPTSEPTSEQTVDEPVQETDNSTAESKTFTPEWLQSKGIDPNDPQAFEKVANMAFNSEKLMSRTQQNAEQLKKSLVDQPVTVDSDSPLVQDLATKVVTMERQQNIASFINETKLTGEQEAKFAEYINSDPNMATLINGGYLSLQQAFRLSGVGDLDASALKSQGKQEALQDLASKQRATAPSGSATNNTVPASLSKANVETWWDNLGSAGRADPANRAKLDSILGS